LSSNVAKSVVVKALGGVDVEFMGAEEMTIKGKLMSDGEVGGFTVTEV
jgi:hypothetical protein